MSCLGQWVSSQCLGQWVSLCHIWVNGAISCLGPGSEGLAVPCMDQQVYITKRDHTKTTLTPLVLPGSGLYVLCLGQQISMCHAWVNTSLCGMPGTLGLCAMPGSVGLYVPCIGQHISMWHACLGLQVPQCHAWVGISLCHAWVSRSLCYAQVSEYQCHVGPLRIVRERHQNSSFHQGIIQVCSGHTWIIP